MIDHSTHIPCAALRPFIRRFHVLENTNAIEASRPQRITPDGRFEINFSLGAPVKRTGDGEGTMILADCYTVGRSSRPYFVQRTGSATVVSVEFEPWGLGRFTPVPLSLINDLAVPSIELFGKGIVELHERLERAKGAGAIQEELERYFIGELGKTGNEDRIVMDAASRLARSSWNIRMSTFMAEYSVTPRRLQQRFQECIGMSPKTFARLIRFRRSLAGLHNGQPLFDTALASGYFDQAHFAHDFGSFAGISPSGYVREAHPLNDAMLRDTGVAG